MAGRVAIQNIVEVLSILGCRIDANMIALLFDMSEDESALFLEEAQKSGAILKNKRELFAAETVTLKDSQTLLHSLPVFCFRYLKNLELENVLPAFEQIVENLGKKKVAPDSTIDFALQVGDVFFHEQVLDVAAKIYQVCVYYCQSNHLSAQLFKESVLNLSRADFSRGSNPAETANLQKIAVSMIDQNAPTLNDALIMLYAGLVQHFVGNEDQGFAMRQQAIEWLDMLSTTSLRHEVVALTGWHIYLSGRFREAINYYEDMILDIENHEDITIATMAYPPIIYSYMFFGRVSEGHDSK